MSYLINSYLSEAMISYCVLPTLENFIDLNTYILKNVFNHQSVLHPQEMFSFLQCFRTKNYDLRSNLCDSAKGGKFVGLCPLSPDKFTANGSTHCNFCKEHSDTLVNHSIREDSTSRNNTEIDALEYLQHVHMVGLTWGYEV